MNISRTGYRWSSLFFCIDYFNLDMIQNMQNFFISTVCYKNKPDLLDFVFKVNLKHEIKIYESIGVVAIE